MRNRSPFGQSFDCPFFCAFLRGFRCIFSYYSFYNGLLFGKYDRCFHQRAQKAAIIIGADCSAFVVNANVTRGEETHMKYITVMIIILVLLSFIGRCSPSPWQRTSCTITVTVRTDSSSPSGPLSAAPMNTSAACSRKSSSAGLPRSAVQPRWQNQPAVLLLLGHCGGGTVKEALSAVFKSD